MSAWPPEIHDLVALSQAGSEAPMLVQGPGGNASVKSSDGRHLYVKASGYRLSEVTTDTGYVTVSLPEVSAVLASDEYEGYEEAEGHQIAASKVADAVMAPPEVRASLETLFHSMFDRCVLHTHAVYANAFACMENGPSELERILNEPACTVPYRAPGYALAKGVKKQHCRYLHLHGKSPSFVLLENHGLIVSGADVGTAVARTSRIIRAGQKFFGEIEHQNAGGSNDADCGRWAVQLQKSHWEQTRRTSVTCAITSGPLGRAAKDPIQRLLGGHLCPDEVVFFHGGMSVCGPGVSAGEWLSYFESPLPQRIVAVLPDRGVVLLAPNGKTLQAMWEGLTAHALVVELISRVGRIRTLELSDAMYLLSMDDEKYRQALTADRRYERAH